MNPENLGTHISDRHSYLWRKSMFIEPRVPDRETCHKQINQFSSTMNSSWRARNNMIRTNFSHLHQSRPLRRGHSVVQDVLREQKMQTKGTKTMLKSLLIDKDALQKSNKLVEGMGKLKEMKLLTGKDLNQVKFPGVIKHEHIYNDYHERLTNPGFSRNQKGKFYTK